MLQAVEMGFDGHAGTLVPVAGLGAASDVLLGRFDHLRGGRVGGARLTARVHGIADVPAAEEGGQPQRDHDGLFHGQLRAPQVPYSGSKVPRIAVG